MARGVFSGRDFELKSMLSRSLNFFGGGGMMGNKNSNPSRLRCYVVLTGRCLSKFRMIIMPSYSRSSNQIVLITLPVKQGVLLRKSFVDGSYVYA
jgi:hypothetical protein